MMKIKGYKKQNDDFFIITKSDIFVEVRGKKITIKEFENLDLFVHSSNLGRKKVWAITEAISGCRIGSFNPDLKKCIEKARLILKEKGIQNIQKQIDNRVNDALISPRYKFTNKNKVKYVAVKKDNYSKFVFPQILRVQI
jgi:hypothetical protein